VTQAAWEALTKAKSPVGTNHFVIDYSPYPPTNKEQIIPFWEIQKIRALASWGAIFPYRTIRIEVWSRTNVILQTYELNTAELQFTKIASGWHMEPEKATIDWTSESAKPTVSFH